MSPIRFVSDLRVQIADLFGGVIQTPEQRSDLMRYQLPDFRVDRSKFFQRPWIELERRSGRNQAYCAAGLESILVSPRSLRRPPLA
jgi:hypothetical protein